MRHPLVIHPACRCDAVRRIEVEVGRDRNGALALRYLLDGDVDALNLPPRAAPERTDELWRHTCFEAFFGEARGYAEFNLSPSTQWAAYRFDSYRQGMRALETPAPHTEVSRLAGGGLELRALVEPPGAAARLGLSAVVEEASGRISYWALRHPPGVPDFHHPDGFALELPAPSAP